MDAAQEQFKEMEDLKDEAESEARQRSQDIEQLEKEKKELQTENERLKMDKALLIQELANKVLLVQALKEDLEPEPRDEEAGPSETKKQKKVPSDP